MAAKKTPAMAVTPHLPHAKINVREAEKYRTDYHGEHQTDPSSRPEPQEAPRHVAAKEKILAGTGGKRDHCERESQS